MQEVAIGCFVDEIKALAHPEAIKGFMSQTALLTLGRMIAMFAELNALKNMKACLNNDFSAFRRFDQLPRIVRNSSDDSLLHH